jgi:hypothetical protein
MVRTVRAVGVGAPLWRRSTSPSPLGVGTPSSFNARAIPRRAKVLMAKPSSHCTGRIAGESARVLLLY